MEKKYLTIYLKFVKLNDSAIIEGIKQHNDVVYNFIYKVYYPVVENFICQNSGSADDAKDIFQNALIVLHNKADEGKLEIFSSFKTYLYIRI